MPARSLPEKFLVAFSLAGEDRNRVSPLALAVERRLGRGTVFLDEWYEHYLAGDDGDLTLTKIYAERSWLVVPCISGNYGTKPWARSEHRAIRALQMSLQGTASERDQLRILPVRVGDGELDGIPVNTIWIDATKKSAEDTADLVVERLRLIVPDLMNRTDAGSNTSAAHIAMLQRALLALSEQELRTRVVAPWLRASGFRIHDNSDLSGGLIAEKEELGISHLYFVLVTNVAQSGPIASPADFLRLLTSQPNRSLPESWVDPDLSISRAITRIVLVTPFELPRVTTTSNGNVSMIAGHRFAEDFAARLPEAAAHFCAGTEYNERLLTRMNAIDESAVYDLPRRLRLDDIYVDGNYTHFDNVLELLYTFLDTDNQIIGGIVVPSKPIRPHCSKEELDVLKKVAKDWRWIPDAAEARFSLEDFVSILLDRVESFIPSKQPEVDGTTASMLSDAAKFQATAQRADLTHILWRRSHTVSAEMISRARALLERLQSRAATLSRRDIVRAPKGVIVTAPAGSGKTTLLRKLAKDTASGGSVQTAVFVRAADVRELAVTGILAAVRAALAADGVAVARGEVENMCASATTTLFIDGVDEAGTDVAALARLIVLFANKFPKCRLFIGTRDVEATSSLKSSGLLSVRVCPFTDGQLKEFVRKWFAHAPDRSEQVIDWLRAFPQMEDTARHPLMAGVLCALHEDLPADDLPVSRLELFDKRFELLLGRWDIAKGVPAMPSRVRERCMTFLIKVGYQAHKAGGRALDAASVRLLARRYMTHGYHRSTDALIDDCLARGVLRGINRDHSRQMWNDYDLDHFSNQEFLAGKCLARHHDAASIAALLGIDWWSGPLIYYASILGDISSLIRSITPEARVKHKRQLDAMREEAPDTDV